MSDDENEKTPVSESPSENKFIDELTMKLLSNQNGYAKYLSNTDTTKMEEQEQFKKDCFEHKNDILSMTRELLSQEDNNLGSDVNESFNNYARIVIRHLEVKQRSDEIQKGYYKSEDDENELFPYSMDEPDTKSYLKFNQMNSIDMLLRKK
jgi:hypothetical protein